MTASGVAAGLPRGDRWWRSLAARVTLVAGTLLVALSCLLIATNALTARQTAAAAIERAAASAADRIADGLASSPSDLARLGDAARVAGLDYAYVEDVGGTVLAGERPAAAPPALDATRPGFAAVAESGGMSHVARSLELPGRGAATLRLGMSDRAADAAARDAAIRSVLAALGFLIAALPMLAYMADRYASPLRDLTRAVLRPGSPAEAVRIAGARRDELGALARAHLTIARDLAENADALHRLTFDDPVTRLPNRASLQSRLAAALQLRRPLALVKFEAQGLGRVADGLGQQSGDAAIRAVAERLSVVVAPAQDVASAVLARGSESGFALLLPNAGVEAAREIAEAALAAFEAPIQIGVHHVSVSLAVGVAFAPEDGDEAGALLRSAAAAVSAARAAGPQSVRFAGAELNRMAYGRLKLEQDLRRAIESGELELHFQPQIELGSRTLSGAEALVRWRHPVRGMISPGEFVPVAEESGLIEPLGRFVLAEAARVAAGWRERGLPVRVAVNVSPIQFRRPNFAEATLATIAAAGAEPGDIELEITESAAMGDPAHAARELTPLKQAGVKIAIDDFGTGYSNLASLTRLPFDVLKIDRAFVRDGATAPGAGAVVAAVTGLAEALGFETVAEGVETEEQLDFVVRRGCTHVQGFLFGKPMPAAAFEDWRADRLAAELRAIGQRAARPVAASRTAAPGRH